MAAEVSGFVVGDTLFGLLAAEVSGVVVGDISLRVMTAETYGCLLPRPSINWKKNEVYILWDYVRGNVLSMLTTPIF